MTPRRTFTIVAALIVIMAVLLLYSYDDAPPGNTTYTPPPNCDYHYERVGLGWEPWEIVYDCE